MKYKEKPGDMKALSSAEVSSCRLLSDNFDCPLCQQLVPGLHTHMLGWKVSYWSRDCFIIQGTLTILDNRKATQVAAWAAVLWENLAGLNFQSECTGLSFSFFSCLPFGSFCVRSTCEERCLVSSFFTGLWLNRQIDLMGRLYARAHTHTHTISFHCVWPLSWILPPFSRNVLLFRNAFVVFLTF